MMNDSDKTGLNNTLTHTISPCSISVYADAAGHGNVTDEALSFLSFNVTEVLYEILRECKTEMNVYRQSSLSNIILSNVFQSYGIPPMYGNKVVVPFMNVPNADISVLQLPKLDLIAEAAADAVTVELQPVPFVRGLYVSPVSEFRAMFNTDNIKIEPKDDPDEPHSSYQMPANNHGYALKKIETDYFLVVSQIVLNSSENLFKILLEDLRTNPRIGGVYCTLLNFVENSIKCFKCVGRLTDRLLRTIDALLDNPHFDPSSSLCVDSGINSLCTLIQDSKIASDCNDFSYRRRASYLLMRALNTWNIDAIERTKILSKLNFTLKSPEKMSLKSIYSILMMFYGLGCDVLDLHFWPFLEKYLNVLSSLDEIISGKRSFSLTTDICHVKSALLLISGILYRNFWVQDESIQVLHLRVDTLLRTYFGEAIAPIRVYPVPRPSPLFVFVTKRSPHEELIDVRKNYRKVHLFTLRKKYPTINVPIKSTRYHHNIIDVFEANLMYQRDTRIIFNFIGSNQRSSEQLRVKKPDQRYNVQCRHASRPFLKYEKVTRCIKYCKTNPSCVGDIYLSL